MDGTVMHSCFTFVRAKHPKFTLSKYVMLSSLTGGNKNVLPYTQSWIFFLFFMPADIDIT